MVRHESVTVSGIVIYCDKCKKEGPGVAYENHDDLTECARMDGWQIGDGCDIGDLCPDCKPKPKKRGRK
jgi:hypothetical protein